MDAHTACGTQILFNEAVSVETTHDAHEQNTETQLCATQLC